MTLANKNKPIITGADYRTLKRNFVLVIMAVSIAPLFLVGGILDRFNTASYRLKVHDHLTEMVHKHAQNIDRFLGERMSDINFVARSFSVEQLRDEEFLRDRLAALQLEYGPTFVDLGVVDEIGNQVAYAGPFQLGQAQYANALWFKQAIQSERYISDVFLGLRGKPHFIVAARCENAHSKFVLRATVDFVAFNQLVETLRIGKTGFAYIINRDGAFQTKPMMDIGSDKTEFLKALFESDASGDEHVRVHVNPDVAGGRHLLVTALLENQDWLMIYQQEARDALSVISRTRKIALVVVLVGCIAIMAISFLLVRKMINHLMQADREKEIMNRKVIETGKLASVGELAAGVAHEINNPVAIMMEEAGWIQDLLEEEEFESGKNLDEFQRALKQIHTQGTRCKEITHKLLSFARKSDSRVQDVRVEELIEEVVALSAQRAKYANVSIDCRMAPDLPVFQGSQTELQQVFMNLVNNALDAMEKDGGTLKLSSHAANGHIGVSVADDGPGIPEANIDRIFDPFFTTKPVGRGTGLGLSICYGIIERMGGKIAVTSQAGKGTTFDIQIPVDSPATETPSSQEAVEKQE
jgi:two-component system NtrC family sensor kinase